MLILETITKSGVFKARSDYYQTEQLLELDACLFDLFGSQRPMLFRKMLMNRIDFAGEALSQKIQCLCYLMTTSESIEEDLVALALEAYESLQRDESINDLVVIASFLHNKQDKVKCDEVIVQHIKKLRDEVFSKQRLDSLVGYLNACGVVKQEHSPEQVAQVKDMMSRLLANEDA